MPTLSVPGGFRNFDVFWCDGDATGAETQSGLVLLVFDRPLPANCLLAVLGTPDEMEGANCLYLHGLGRTPTATAHGAPIPGEWSKFDLQIVCLGATAEVDRVGLKFDRHAIASKKSTKVLNIFLERGRFLLAAPPNADPRAAAMRLYQRADPAGVIGPSTRLADATQPAYQLHTRSPRRSPAAGPPTPRQSTAPNRSFEVVVTANTREAAGMLKHTRLWHTSLALLGISDSTLGIFESPLPTGFRQVERAQSTQRRLVFTVAGAAPGDILAFTTGMDESPIALVNASTEGPQGAAGSLAVFEIDRDGELKTLQSANLAPTILPLGQNPSRILRQMQHQLERISAQWSGARIEIARLAHAVAGSFANQATLAELAAHMTSPATFAVALALHGDLIESCPDASVATEIASIVAARREGFLERLASASIELAVERQDIRHAVMRQVSGNSDPWLGPDGLQSVFEALFDRPGMPASAGAIESDDWYRQTADPAARIAVLAIATDPRRGPDGLKTAQRLIGAGLSPDLPDTAARDLDSLLAFAEDQFVGPLTDRARHDALVWAAAELADGSDYDPALEDIHSRLEEARDNTVLGQGKVVALHDLRRWRNAVRLEELDARLNDINDLLAKSPAAGLRAIPRFDREHGPFASGFDEATLRRQLRNVAGPDPAWEALARNAGASSKWPNAARAALLATIGAIAQGPSPDFDATRHRRPEAEEDIRNAAVLFDPALDADGDLLRKLKEYAAQEQAELEKELLEQAGPNGKIDAERRDDIRANARQRAALNAAKKLFHDVEDLIERIGLAFKKAEGIVAKTDTALQSLTGTAQQRAAERFHDLIDKLTKLRNGYVNGVEIRLEELKRSSRNEVFGDIPAVEADMQSATEDFHALQEILAQIQELPSAQGD
jgi:hypothetical protein